MFAHTARRSLRRTGPSVALAMLASLGVHSRASAQTPAPVTIQVDATELGPALEPVWAYFGYDEVNYTTTPEGEALLGTLSAVHEAPVHIRSHFLLNTGDGTPALKWGSTNVYTEAEDGTPVYDFTLLDQIMDTTLRAGTFPLVEIGFMPQALSTQPEPYQNSNTYVLDGGCFYPPRDYAAWGALVNAWATHVKERYPADAEASFEWELWNEPDIGYWQGSFEEFAELYDHTEAALHAVLPQASLGGPAAASPYTGFLRDFLEHCATGTNAVTGETGTRLDMVSFHAKGGVLLIDEGHVQMNLGNQLDLHREGFAVVSASPMFAQTPIVISEADPDGCAACPADKLLSNAYRNSPAYGAYEVVMMKRSLELAADFGVNLRGVLSWAFTFPGTPYFAGYRALSTNGIHLPVLNAFKLLGGLSGQRLSVTSSGALPLSEMLANSVRDVPDVDALATSDGDRIQILVWNYHDDLLEAAPVPVTLEVTLPPAFTSHALVTHTRADENHGNAYGVWVSQGSPEAPTDAQLSELRASMEPVVLEAEHSVKLTDRSVKLSFELPRFGLSLLTLTPAKEPEPAPPSDDGCSCQLPTRSPASLTLLLTLWPAMAFVRRRQRCRRARQARADYFP